MRFSSNLHLPFSQILLKSDWVLALILVFSFLLRIVNLSHQNLWIDESVHILQAKSWLQGNFKVYAHDLNGILFTLLLTPLFKLFGAKIVIARLLSVFFGVGTVWLVFKVSKKLFSKPVALIACSLAAISPLLIFWSKIARNYSIGTFFFLLLISILLHIFPQNKQDTVIKKGAWALFGIVLLAGLFSHYLLGLSVISIGIFLLIRSSAQIKKTHLPVVGFSAILLFLIFILISRYNQDLADWAIPDLAHLKEIYNENPWYGINTYFNLFYFDLPILSIAGFSGLIMLWFFNKKTFTFFGLFLLLPFILLSFIFREPTAPRYVIFFYPLFLMLTAFGLERILNYLLSFLVPAKIHAVKSYIPLIALLFIGILLPYAHLKNLIKFSCTTGHIIDKRVVECTFSDWKSSCEFVESKLTSGAVIAATTPQMTSVYFNDANVLWFRQNNLDFKSKRYVPNKPGAVTGNSASTTQDFIRTVKNNPSGWLLADFYLESAFTDPVARNFVFRNLHFHPEASKDGSIMVFSWDGKPPVNQNFILQVGRSEEKFVSRELVFSVPDSVLRKDYLTLLYKTKFIESKGEASFEINNHTLDLETSLAEESKLQSLVIPRSMLKRGQNVFKFRYKGPFENETVKGYVVYYIDFKP